ncbi:MAG: hypothetical protein GY851_09440 [bacterium]|nr:hypothetical protein [bacterium]
MVAMGIGPLLAPLFGWFFARVGKEADKAIDRRKPKKKPRITWAELLEKAKARAKGQHRVIVSDPVELDDNPYE